MLSNARQAIGRALDPIAGALIAARITANALTLIGLLGTIAAAVFVGMGEFGIGAAFFVPSAVLDLFDGMIARKMGTSSTWGALIDAVSDRIGEGALMIAFSYRFRDVSPRLSVLALAALVFSYLVSYTRAERAILFGAALLLGGAAEVVIWILAVLTAWTFLQRMLTVRRQAVALRASQR
jgi:CDP-diacylglycerol--glycerol-3-phosphate 3-phosphatidyltransferase